MSEKTRSANASRVYESPAARLIRALPALGLLLSGAAHAGTLEFNPAFTSASQSLWGNGGEARLNLGATDTSARWNYEKYIGPGFIGSRNACIGVTVFGDCAGFTADTRLGLQATVATAGELRYRSDLGLTAGAVDTTLDYSASLSVPDTIAVGEFINLNPASSLVSGQLETKFPTLTGKISVGVSAGAVLFGEACATFVLGCSTFSETLFDIGGIGSDLEFYSGIPGQDANGCIFGNPAGFDVCDVLSFVHNNTYTGVNMVDVFEINTVGLEDRARLFGFPSQGVDVTKKSLFADVELATGKIEFKEGSPTDTSLGYNVARLGFNAPDLPTSGSTVIGNTISSFGEFDDLVNLEFDLDGIATYAFKSPPLGVSFTIGDYLELRANVLDIDVGPTIDIAQKFDLTSELWADLAFSNPVGLADGSTVTSLSGAWDNLPGFKLLSTQTTVTPTFSNRSMLSNRTDLKFDLEWALGVLELERIKVGPLDITGLLPSNALFSSGGELLQLGSANRFNGTFALGGFSDYKAQAFTLTAGNVNPPGGGGGPVMPPVKVPEPGTLALLCAGLIGLLRRPRKVGRAAPAA